jgi:hypothetical protein
MTESSPAPAPFTNALRNMASGFLAGYGFAAFFLSLWLQARWVSAAPRVADRAAALVYPHNEHGVAAYFSAFQATAGTLLFSTSIPLVFLSAIIVPKLNITGDARWYAFRLQWDRNDPRHFWLPAFIVGGLAAPVILFAVGPPIIRALNAAGIVLNLG